MDFEVSEFQIELADGIRRLCEGRFPLEVIRSRESTDHVVDRAGWKELGDAGVFHLCLAEEAGGQVGGHQGSRNECPAQLFEDERRLGQPETHAAGLIDGADDGSVVVGLIERPVPGAVGTGVLPVVVEHLADLDVLLVLSEDGIERLDPAALDATPLPRPMDPLTPVWSLSDLPVGEPVAGREIATWWRRDGAVLTASCQVGMAQWACDIAVEYAKGRVQFGRPIGGFQAVKHLCADMAVRAEVARIAVQAAAVTVDQPDVGDPELAAAGAKLLADEAAMANGRSSIQVHGGMGFTWEVPAHLAYKRARVLSTQFGTADALAEELANALAGA
jgi:alkylation response protein AidB-like acyl-CoA dehydrogenase